MTNRVAIITGASRGIGEAIAVRIANDGYSVVVGYKGAKDKADNVVKAITSAGGEAIAVQVDIADEASVKSLFSQTVEKFGGVDAVVNSAGMMQLSPIAEGNIELFDQTIATNLRGTFLVLSQAAQNVREGGRIVAISTSVVVPAFPTYGAYVSAKAGSEGLVRVLANEMRGKNITVNAVSPGPVATELFLHGKPQAVIDKLSKIPPLERLGQPEDIASTVSFLLGKDGGWINAQIIRANGGFV
ncbi:MAG: SDR family oxidoreductase [OCS116 cluster bacterium]|uniref:3-ketoacyl-ACP reductase n=1 Tax=OCS116 cluster bacterium TaxID=2030921 RepID=A0A2A4Z0F5_9PROT|nr:SDR family oxidoreductase [OCS116 cluster bacterium]